MNNIPSPGIYRHFKGNRYELLYIARHSETGEEMAVYRALYGEGGVWVRPLAMWSELVEYKGQTVPRFRPDTEDEPAPEPEAAAPVSGKIAYLRRFYGYEKFRPGQEEVIDSILSGRDTLAVMPTGGGKSICYQLPSLMTAGVAIVVSPLISLMKDQVQALLQNGIPAAYLNSSLTERQMELAVRNMIAGKYKIVYVAPERLQTQRFLEAACALDISLLAIDEAHCISQWGQDFRPSYLEIPEFIRRLPVRPVVCAFTATATARVREDIRTMIGLENPFETVTGFDRKNLYFSVCQPASKKTMLRKLLSRRRKQSGIIYCATRKGVEALAEDLDSVGLSVTRYHAGLSDEERIRNQEDFTYDRRQIMVATNAFGMGIDKSNVRFVIHYNMPKDLESYYQEAGRAGRDGERSDCILMFGLSDVETQKFFIDHMGEENNLDPETLKQVQESARQRLKEMVGYCKTPGCLRAYILRYFGEKAPETCGFCGNCAEPQEMADLTLKAQHILECVTETGERYGRSILLNVLRGEIPSNMAWLRESLCYAIEADAKEATLRAAINRMVDLDILREEPQETARGTFTALSRGGNADALERDEIKVEVLAREIRKDQPGRRTRADKPELRAVVQDQELFDRLVQLRMKISRARGVPPYAVFHDSTLMEMAMIQPETMEEMLGITGIGEKKLADYGKSFIREIKKYLQEKEN